MQRRNLSGPKDWFFRCLGLCVPVFGIVFPLLFLLPQETQAADITISTFSASSYTLSATNVTYDVTFATASNVGSSGYFQFSIDGSTGVRSDFTNVAISTLTDDGADISGNVSMSLNSPQDGKISGFTLFVNSGTVETGSTVVIAMTGITNPSLEGNYYPYIVDSGSNQSHYAATPLQPFGSPMIKLKVTEPDGTTPVANAYIWCNNVSTSNYFGASGTTDVGGQLNLFGSSFNGPTGVSKNGQYQVQIQPPTGSQYTRPASLTVTLDESSTKDCTNAGSDCATNNGGPIKLTRPMAKGKFVVPTSPPASCLAAAGSAIADVQVQVRNTESMDPASSTWVWSDSSGIFYIGGLSAGTYALEFSLNWGNQNYVGLVAPDAKLDFVVSDTNADGNLDVTYSSATTLAASLPYDFGDLAFQTANKTISGTVADSSGNPIPNIKLRANKSMGMGDAQTASGADGTYSLKVGTGAWVVMPQFDYYQNYDNDPANDVNASWIFCGMGKTVNFQQANTVTESSAGNNFSLKQSNATITGTVVKPDGNHVSGNASVNAFAKDGCGGYSSVDFGTGTFTITVPPGTYTVQAQSWDQAYGSSPATAITASSGTTNIGNLSLVAKSSTITGRLWADSNGNGTYDDGEGVGNVRVESFKMAQKYDEFSGGRGGPMGGGDWASTTSSNVAATKGIYTLYVTRGSWVVNVMADVGMMSGGYSTTATNYIYTGSPREVNVSADNSSSADNNFKLAIADGTINGRLWVDTDADSEFDNGEGVSGIYGYAFAESSSTYNQGPMMGMGMGAAVNNGTFTIKAPAGTYKVGVDFPPENAGYTVSSMATVTVAANGTATANVPVLANNATVRVRFKDTNGNLVTNLQYAEAFLHNVGGAHLWKMFSSSDLTNGYVDIPAAAGVWNLGYHIDPTTNNYMSEPASDNSVTAVASQTVTKDVTLRSADSTVSGTVYDPNGSPLAGVFVSVDNRKASNFTTGAAMFMRGAVTGSDGTYSLTLPAGTYKVEARFPPSATVGGQTVSYLNPDASEVTISSTSPATANFTFKTSDATITGTVTLSGTAQGAFVSAYSDQGGYNEVVTNDGAYSLGVTKDDTWYLRAMYETGNSYYLSDVYQISMGGAATKSQNLALAVASFTVPDAVSTTFNCANAKQITLSNGASISIPANAVVPSSVSSCSSSDSGSNITISVNPTAQMSLQDKAIPVGVGYEITASDANGNTISDNFDSNVTITIPYSSTEISTAIGGAADESLLNNGYWDTATSAWRSVDGQVLDTTNNTVSISTNHFTLYGVIAATNPSSTTGGSVSSSSSSTGSSSASSYPAQAMAPTTRGSITNGALNKVVLWVHAGAVAWDANFEIHEIYTGFKKPKPPLWIISGPYQVVMKSWWNGAKFNDFLKPVTLIVRYDPTALGKIPEDSLNLYYYDEARGKWQPTGSVLKKDRHELVAVITKLQGKYAVIGNGSFQAKSAATCQVAGVQAKSEVTPAPTKPKEPAKAEVPAAPVPQKKEGWFGRLVKKILPFIH